MNNNNKALSKSNERQNKIINDTDISNPYINKIKAKKIYAKKLSPQNEINKSHDLNNDLIRAKLKKNYNINYFKKYNNITNYNNSQDMSCDINSNNNIIKENETILNKTNDSIIKRNNTELNPRNTYDFKNNENIPVYKKKIKLSQTKTKIYINKAEKNNIRNKMIKLNCSNKTADQLLSPNLNKNNIKNINKNFEKIIATNLANTQNLNKIRSVYTEPKKEINNNLREIEHNKFEKIQELSVNLSKKENILVNNINNKTNNIKKQDIFMDKNNNDKDGKELNNEKEQINQAQTPTKNENNDNNEKAINENINQENINNKNENNTNDNENDNNNNTETITITNNNDNNDYNAMSNDNNIINDDTDESDDNVAKEIIVKDVSTRDKRLNVFIKYVELSQFNTLNNEFNNIHLINSFKTDSIYVPRLYPPKQNRNYYYDKYFYGNKNDKNNKLKLHQILSSIIEEEEKSKAAGSINNSFLSEEETSKIGKNYSHFFIQSIKYVSNYLQNIFDDKKKDMYFQFLKILKKIKNESFLRGLINQKKFQTLTKLKEEENDSENENNNSENIILYNNNYKSNNDSNFKNKEKEINENKKYIEEYKCISNSNVDIKYKKSLSNKNILKINKSCYPFDDVELKKNRSFSYSNLNKERKNEIINNNKLKRIIINMEEVNNWNLIEKTFKNWKKEINFEDKKEEYSDDIQINYEKNVTISEACRGLSDVILDFKIFLIKYSIKNRNGKE